ncbi:glycosyltransferase [Candidatus Saccharibacteria bacterium]|nr:MAG: glycosyltransferase [Candidatus Saccharibacteria bacterium]
MSDAVLEEEFSRAEGLLFPGLEDFGITPVEAMAAGMPVIAYKAGGSLDYIRPNVTGEFFERQTVTSLAKVLQQFNGAKYSSAAIKAYATKFSKEKFTTNIKSFLVECIKQHRSVAKNVK